MSHRFTFNYSNRYNMSNDKPKESNRERIRREKAERFRRNQRNKQRRIEGELRKLRNMQHFINDVKRCVSKPDPELLKRLLHFKGRPATYRRPNKERKKRPDQRGNPYFPKGWGYSWRQS